jgi:hypothetical protein
MGGVSSVLRTERNNMCVSNSVTKLRIVKHGSIHMNDRESSDIEIFESKSFEKGNTAVYDW